MAKMQFASKKEKTTSNSNTDGRWKVIISDDEEQVHHITKMALDGFQFAEQGLEFFSAFTGEQTKQLIKQHPDTAIILQDVVMESDQAGLDVVKYIREEMGNGFVRIVLRTGQPGQAPERKVIVEYDINDYKEKTELTSQKLFTLMHSSLRSYRDIMALDKNKNGLQKIIDATADIFSRQSIERFTSATLDQLTALLYQNKNAVYCEISRLAAKTEDLAIEIISASGNYEKYIGKDARKVLNDDIIKVLDEGLREKKNIFTHNSCVAYFSNQVGDERLLYLTGVDRLTEIDQHLVNVFIKNVSISFDNLSLYKDLESAQVEIVNCLGQAIETHSHDAGSHVKRVAEYSKLFAQKYGLPPSEVELLKLASPLHDIGKIGIPEYILNKPEALDSHEWHIMKTHVKIGYDMLRQSDRAVMKTGAVIAYQHHEKWDGSGYPDGKQGEEIHLYARITALADVFDTLGHEKCYRAPWDIDKIMAYFEEQKGKHFDPGLVDILKNNLAEFMLIRDTYRNE